MVGVFVRKALSDAAHHVYSIVNMSNQLDLTIIFN